MTAALELHSHRWLVAVEEGTNHTVVVYLAVEKDNIFVNILLLKIFFADHCYIYPDFMYA